MAKVHDEDCFLVKKENIVMTGTTDETLGKIPFIIYPHSNLSGKELFL